MALIIKTLPLTDPMKPVAVHANAFSCDEEKSLFHS